MYLSLCFIFEFLDHPLLRRLLGEDGRTHSRSAFEGSDSTFIPIAPSVGYLGIISLVDQFAIKQSYGLWSGTPGFVFLNSESFIVANYM